MAKAKKKKEEARFQTVEFVGCGAVTLYDGYTQLRTLANGAVQGEETAPLRIESAGGTNYRVLDLENEEHKAVYDAIKSLLSDKRDDRVTQRHQNLVKQALRLVEPDAPRAPISGWERMNVATLVAIMNDENSGISLEDALEYEESLDSPRDELVDELKRLLDDSDDEGALNEPEL